MPAGRSISKVNLDETAVCIFQGGAKGNVLLSKRHLRGHRLVQKVPRGRTRTYLTHVAFICDQPEIQAVLPQFVIGNEATLPAAMMPSLRAACPNFVHLVRQKSAWNNQVLCATIVRTLALALRPYLNFSASSAARHCSLPLRRFGVECLLSLADLASVRSSEDNLALASARYSCLHGL